MNAWYNNSYSIKFVKDILHSKRWLTQMNVFFASNRFSQRFTYEIRTLASMSSSNVKHFKMLIAGGGTGGASSAHNFVRKLGRNDVAVIEPADYHYYQPMWTLVGAGAKKFSQSAIPMHEALPKNVKWYKDRLMYLDPDSNGVTLESGTKLTYDYLIIAIGIKLDYAQIPGVIEGLQHDARICSNYSALTVGKTYKAFKNFHGGNAVFTLPNTPIKCGGAPQKIMYLFDDFLRKERKRESANIHFCSALPAIFGVKKYADVLSEVCKSRNLHVHTRTNLIELDHNKSLAVFENLDSKEKSQMEYTFVHISPPMVAYDVIKKSKLSDANGFVDVNKETLQSTKFPNVFSLGDCSSLPTAKTAAAISVQHHVLYKNLSALMNNESPNILKYDGYTSCPLVTKYNKCILAEFDYNGQPLETFPINQARESKAAFIMKAHVMPQLYWHGLIRGRWNGPDKLRKLLQFGTNK